jgi:flagellar biosynthetic protein FliR
MIEVANYILVFVRAGALLAVFPMFSATNVPVQIRLALGALASFLLAPLLPVVAVSGLSVAELVRLIFIEASVGLLLGFVCRIVFFAAEFAGGLASTEMGLMLSSVYNPAAGSTMAPPSVLLYWLAIVLFLTLDLHHWLIVAFQKSYVYVPIGGAHLSNPLLAEVTMLSANVFRIGVLIAAPVIAVSFVITLMFATLGRAVPQMNVFNDSFSVRTLVGMAAFGLTCNLMAQYIANFLRHMPEDVLRVAQLLGHG